MMPYKTKYKINDKYHIILKANSVHIVVTETNQELKQYKNSHGYYMVYLYPVGYYSSKAKPKAVHSLVAEVILPNYRKGLEVNHIDGVKTNNHPSNLELVTHKANMHHAKMTGLLNSKKNRQIKAQNKKEIEQYYKDLAYINHMINKLGK